MEQIIEKSKIYPMVKARNIKRLRQNIRERNLKLGDIENAYPFANAPKSLTTEYWDLYESNKDDITLLEMLEGIK